jgi:hypothetical protein
MKRAYYTSNEVSFFIPKKSITTHMGYDIFDLKRGVECEKDLKNALR